jgi:pimeloyl-ACP methyl ester carboxylesterase
MTVRTSPKKVHAYFKGKNIAEEQSSYKIDYREIHYVQTGDKEKPLILFVHGSPGSLNAFIHFLADSTLLDQYLMISTDRPGFGYSNFGNGEPSIDKQAECLMPIVEKYKNNKPVILVGHSLAAAVIAQMAINHPDLIDGLVIVAGSIDPDLEPNEAWFRIPLSTPFLSWLLPRSLRASNEELYNFKSELIDMLPHWKEIKIPVAVVQGKKDVLVDPGNAEFARRMITNAPVEIIYEDDMDHFVPWSDPELIDEGISLVEKMIKAEKIN